MNDAGSASLLVSMVALIGTSFSAWLNVRAHRTTAEAGERSAQSAGLFEGYDEFVAHLRGRVTELEAAVKTAEANATTEADGRGQCLEDLAAVRLQAAILRRALGWPPGYDPLSESQLIPPDYPRPYGRRDDDGSVPPPDWPGREHWPTSPEEGATP